jgi:hypothetical protein
VAASPYDDRAAADSASSKDPTTRTAATGPKVSSCMTAMSSVQPTSTVGGYQAPGPVRHLSPGQRLGAGSQRLLHVVVDHLALPSVDQRPDLEALRLLDERGQEGVRHVGVHVDPLHADADLPGVGEGAQRHLLGGPGGVDPGVDDARVLAAALEHRVGAGTGGGLADGGARRGGADVVDHVHVGVGGQQPRRCVRRRAAAGAPRVAGARPAPRRPARSRAASARWA